jgi:MoxR-like ATPase
MEFVGWAAIENTIAVVRRTLLWGPASVGKSHTAIKVLTQLYGRDKVARVSLNGGMSALEVLGLVVPNVATGKLTFTPGPGALAWQGGALVLEELNAASGEVLSLLHTLCDDSALKGTLTLPNGESLEGHPRFKVVATMNPDPNLVIGRELLSRFVSIECSEVHPDALLRFPEHLRARIAAAAVDSDLSCRITTRQWAHYFELVEAGFGEGLAMNIAFADKASMVLAALGRE